MRDAIRATALTVAALAISKAAKVRILEAVG